MKDEKEEKPGEKVDEKTVETVKPEPGKGDVGKEEKPPVADPVIVADPGKVEDFTHDDLFLPFSDEEDDKNEKEKNPDGTKTNTDGGSGNDGDGSDGNPGKDLKAGSVGNEGKEISGGEGKGKIETKGEGESKESLLAPDDEEKEIEDSVEKAKEVFKAKFGRDPDEFSHTDNFKINRLADSIHGAKQHQRVIMKKWKTIEDDLLPQISSPEVAKFVESEVESISVKEARQISEKAREGNFDPYAEVVRRAIKKYNEKKGIPGKAAEKVKEIVSNRSSENPPVLSGGSQRGGSGGSEPDEGLSLFGLE